MLICGFLYWNLIKPVSLGAGVSIFSVILCSLLMIYFSVSGIRQSMDSFICLGIVALSSINFVLFDNVAIKALNFIFLSVSVVYWICLTNRKRIDEKLSIYFIGDMINQLLIIPFSNLLCLFTGLKSLAKKNKNGKGFLSIIIGLLIILPVLIIVVNLLADADAAFEGLIKNIRFSLSDSMVEYIIQIGLGLPVACYLYGNAFGNKYNRNTSHLTIDKINKNTSALRFAPGLTIHSALTALNLIFVIFFISQATYLFSAFGNSIPDAMSYAEYARRGFFELCTIAGINLMVLTIAHIIITKEDGVDKGDLKSSLIKKTSKILKIETLALCIFTIMLIITALSKMVMYINIYGLTQLRVYTTWFMILLFGIFVTVAFSQLKFINGSRVVIISFVILFMILSYGNIDGMIAKYNIDRYSAGTLKQLDIEALAQLSDAAIPHLYELYQETEDEELKASIKYAIINGWEPSMLETQYKTSFRDFNLQKYKADKIRATI